jgi:hypothetical protein
MTFAKWVFRVAGIFGVIVILPMFFREAEFGREMPPPVNHPEFFYGFAGIALAFQVLFLVISLDPVRMRPAMIPAILEKLGFVIPVIALHLAGRVPRQMVHAAFMDLSFVVLFLISYFKTPSQRAKS